MYYTTSVANCEFWKQRMSLLSKVLPVLYIDNPLSLKPIILERKILVQPALYSASLKFLGVFNLKWYSPFCHCRTRSPFCFMQREYLCNKAGIYRVSVGDHNGGGSLPVPSPERCEWCRTYIVYLWMFTQYIIQPLSCGSFLMGSFE